jgi:hypothetical protein
MGVVLNGADRPFRLPEIVAIVFQEASRLRNQGELTQPDFEEKLARLAAEELTPRGLELMVRDLPNGATRFLIKESRTGRICEMLDCERRLAPAADESRPTETAAALGAMIEPKALEASG